LLCSSFRVGIAKRTARAFLSPDIVDTRVRALTTPFGGRAFAANPAIYRIGINVDATWIILLALGACHRQPGNAAPYRNAPCTHSWPRSRSRRSRHRLESLPIPISTPGFDVPPPSHRHCVITPPATRTPAVPDWAYGPLKIADPPREHDDAPKALAGGFGTGRSSTTVREDAGAIVVGARPVVGVPCTAELPPWVDELTLRGGPRGAPIMLCAGGRTVVSCAGGSRAMGNLSALCYVRP